MQIELESGAACQVDLQSDRVMVEWRIEGMDPMLGCNRSVDRVTIFANQLRLQLATFLVAVVACGECVFAACGSVKFSSITCASTNGRESESADNGVKGVEQLPEKKRRAELSARIASGELTVERSGFPSRLRNGLSKLGIPHDILEALFNWTGANEGYPKIPEAKGAVNAIRSEAFFLPLYELYLTYGGIFRLTFGPKSFLIVSDPSMAKHILKDNSKGYSKGILAEILEFVMGKGLIPADGEIWRVRRRAIVPALHQKYVAAMIDLFGKATDRLCKKLDTAASEGEDAEMESLFSRLTLDVIGKAVFNYDFDSLTNDTGIVEAVYTVLREAEDRSVAPIPVWEIPIWKDISPRLKKVNAALKLINDTLDDLIAICKPGNLFLLLVSMASNLLVYHAISSKFPWCDMGVDNDHTKHDRPSCANQHHGTYQAPAKAHMDHCNNLSLTRSLVSTNFKNLRRIPSRVLLVIRLSSCLNSKSVNCLARMVDEEELQFHEEYMNEQDPSILHFLLASGDDVSSKQLRDDLMTMLIAGHETSAAVLTWTFYLLSKEPAVLSKLQDEVDSILGDRFPTIGDMKKLKYTARVINEITNTSIYCFSYLPFGGGPRKCVGDMFATFENIVAVAMLVRQFNFQMALGAPQVEMTTGATIHTTNGLRMTVTRRIKPPIMPVLKEDASVGSSFNGDTTHGNKHDISPAHFKSL
ncbi:protein LUTEIN DEFICIENT 5 [Citrus sinensis]|nr:protein LUTEIN DEFICIENT 5 [Citrus sinensis]